MTQSSSDGTRSLKQALSPQGIRALIAKQQWPSPSGYLHRENSYCCLNARETQIKAHSCRRQAFFWGARGETRVAQWGPTGTLRTQDLINFSPSGRGFFTPGLLQQRRCYMIKKSPKGSPCKQCATSHVKLSLGERIREGKWTRHTDTTHSILISEWEVPDTMTTSLEK